jgi:hypothetical protein
VVLAGLTSDVTLLEAGLATVRRRKVVEVEEVVVVVVVVDIDADELEEERADAEKPEEVD